MLVSPSGGFGSCVLIFIWPYVIGAGGTQCASMSTKRLSEFPVAYEKIKMPPRPEGFLPQKMKINEHMLLHPWKFLFPNQGHIWKKDTSLPSLFLLQRMKTNEHMRSYPWEFWIPESGNSMEKCHPHPLRVLTLVEWKVMNTNTLPRGVSYSRLRQINETWYASP